MTDTVQTNMGITFRAWTTPSYATMDLPARPKGDGMKELPTFAIEDLAADALDALARQWLDHLYAKVARPNPFKLEP